MNLKKSDSSKNNRYKRLFSGVIIDTRTCLDWYPVPRREFTWDEANTRVGKLSVNGGNWRLPTMDELFSIRNSNNSTGFDKAFKIKYRGVYLWSTKPPHS